MSNDEREQSYEPPQVEELPAEDGPAVTAAGKSPPGDTDSGPEWQPSDRRDGADS
jgi:hypothetical protein